MLYITHSPLYGQAPIKITMHNSSTIRGELLNINIYGDLTIKMFGRDTFIISNNLIKHYDVDGYKPAKTVDKTLFYRKYKFHTEASRLVGEQFKGWGIKQSFNRSIYPYLYAGATIGVDNYTLNAELNVFSVGANLRYYFQSMPHHPFVSLNGGYGAFYAQQKYNQVASKGGTYFNPSVGFSFGKRVSFDIALGLRFQNAQVQYQLGELESAILWKYKRLALQVGVTF